MKAGKIENICTRLRRKLEEAVEKRSYDSAFLSGGLDTSVINYIASRHGNDFESISVGFEESSMKDLKYAEIMEEELNLDLHVFTFDFEEAKNAARDVVKIMRSFDPIEIRNDISIYVGLKKAKELGLESILTGDGSDELLAGYPFLYKLPQDEMEEELDKIWRLMKFSSQQIGKYLEISVELPYLDEQFKKFAMNIPPDVKVGEWNEEKFGKWILRKAYEDKLPIEIIWRRKIPIEIGSGTTILPDKFKSDLDRDYFKAKKEEIAKEDEVMIRSEEQLFYYQIYKSFYGPPKAEDPDKRKCPYCKTNVPEKVTFCRTCGSGLENR